MVRIALKDSLLCCCSQLHGQCISYDIGSRSVHVDDSMTIPDSVLIYQATELTLEDNDSVSYITCDQVLYMYTPKAIPKA